MHAASEEEERANISCVYIILCCNVMALERAICCCVEWQKCCAFAEKVFFFHPEKLSCYASLCASVFCQRMKCMATKVEEMRIHTGETTTEIVHCKRNKQKKKKKKIWISNELLAGVRTHSQQNIRENERYDEEAKVPLGQHTHTPNARTLDMKWKKNCNF